MAHLQGYHRDLCLLSYVFRGTPEVPGLVMGLNPNGECIGRAFFVLEENREATLKYLDEREMINQVYAPSWVNVTFEDGTQSQAYTFVAVLDHAQYVGHLNLDEKVSLVLQGRGKAGTSFEYLENTCLHLRELSIEDSTLEAILSAARSKNT